MTCPEHHHFIEMVTRYWIPDIQDKLDPIIIFRDEAMEHVISRLDRWFNVDIKIIDAEIKNYSYTATFQHETLEQILDLLQRSAPIEYKIINRGKNKNNEFTKTRGELYSR